MQGTRECCIEKQAFPFFRRRATARPCIAGGQGAPPRVDPLGARPPSPRGGPIPAPNCILPCTSVIRRALQTACRTALCRPAAAFQSALTCTHTTPCLAIHFHVLAVMASKQKLQQSNILDQWEGGIFIGKLHNDSNNRLDLRTCIALLSNPTSLVSSMRACHVCAPCVPCMHHIRKVGTFASW